MTRRQKFGAFSRAATTAATTALLLLSAGARAAEDPAPVDGETRTHVTESGHVIEVQRSRYEGDNGGVAGRREFSVTDPDGNEVRSGTDTRWRGPEGNAGQASSRTRTGPEGGSVTHRRAGGTTAEGGRWQRGATVATDAEGDVRARRGHRRGENAEGDAVRARHQVRHGERGSAAGRQVERRSADGQRSRQRQRVRRPNG